MSFETNALWNKLFFIQQFALNSELLQALIDRLQTESPNSVLIVAPEIPIGLQEYVNQSKDLTITHINLSELDSKFSGLGRFDFVVVFDAVDSFAKRITEQMISRLRDLHAKLLWVMVNDNEDDVNYGKKDAIAQGLRLVDPDQFGRNTFCWFEFSLHFYKPIPQWLNAKNWANPEQWDKNRW